MPKFRVVISVGIHNTVVEAKDRDEAIEMAGNEFSQILESKGPEEFCEVYPLSDLEAVEIGTVVQ